MDLALIFFFSGWFDLSLWFTRTCTLPRLLEYIWGEMMVSFRRYGLLKFHTEPIR